MDLKIEDLNLKEVLYMSEKCNIWLIQVNILRYQIPENYKHLIVLFFIKLDNYICLYRYNIMQISFNLACKHPLKLYLRILSITPISYLNIYL